MRGLLLMGLLIVGSGPLLAQGYGGYAPGNTGNGFQQYGGYQSPALRQGQPLSPYLNLLGGRNSAANYYNFTRPGTVGGVGTFGGLYAPGINRNYQPNMASPLDLDPNDRALPPSTPISPTGHPAGFNDFVGYYGGGRGGASNANRGISPSGQGASGRRGPR